MRKNNVCVLILILCNFSLAAQNFQSVFNQGLVCYKTDPSQALKLFQQALAFDQSSVEAHYNCAYLLKNAGAMHEAIPHYHFVITHQPQHVSAHIGIAQAYLATGNYEQGWQALEWRHGHVLAETQEFKRYIAQNGSLKNKIILLRAEWGAGDTLQMLRYAQLLKSRGASVVIHLLHQSLVPLISQQPYIDKVVPPSEYPPPFHAQIPMISLPLIFGTTVTTIPCSTPYISIDQTRVAHWKEKLSHDSNFKIGICWHGNTIHGEEKFMPLHYFAQLAEIPGISLYSLQKMHGLDQLEKLEKPKLIKTFDADFDTQPFLDSAAVIKNLDLILTVDTSIAHLAGALGMPTWLILHNNAEWRWMLDRADTPWYPTMKLIRQRHVQNWQPVIEEIRSLLHATKKG